MKYFLGISLILFTLSACDKMPEKWNDSTSALENISNQLQNKEHRYFKVKCVKRWEESEEELNAIADYLGSDNGYILSAYFSLNNEHQFHYLHTLSDNTQPIHMLEGNGISYGYENHLNDSILSPAVLKPSIIEEYFSNAKSINYSFNESDQLASLKLQMEERIILLAYDTKNRFLKQFRMIDSNKEEVIWNYTVISSEEYKTLVAQADQLVDRGSENYL